MIKKEHVAHREAESMSMMVIRCLRIGASCGWDKANVARRRAKTASARGAPAAYPATSTLPSHLPSLVLPCTATHTSHFPGAPSRASVGPVATATSMRAWASWSIVLFLPLLAPTNIQKHGASHCRRKTFPPTLEAANEPAPAPARVLPVQGVAPDRARNDRAYRLGNVLGCAGHPQRSRPHARALSTHLASRTVCDLHYLISQPTDAEEFNSRCQ